MSLTILQAHVLDQLPTLPDGSVHCVVTSPPYWGLRDYKLPPVLWPTGWTGCHGLEPTMDLYIQHEVLIFREVRRVLRDDGTLWLNLGDSMASVGKWGGSSGGKNEACKKSGDYIRQKKEFTGLKPKDLCGIPWRVALALQADGWYLRCDIIWSKSNPMPESVTDRPTKSHEYLFLLTKQPRYFYDAEAIKESCNSGPSDIKKMVEKKDRIDAKHFHHDPGPLACANPRTNIGNKRGVGDPTGRNRRSVWTIASEPFKGAHFATFPKALVLPCVLAGTSARGCCAKCGAPWERIVEQSDTGVAASGNKEKRWGQNHTHQRELGEGEIERHSSIPWNYQETKTVGWKPTCKCDCAEVVPCTVLDPFLGSGTTAQVALEHGRRAIGIELSTEYEKFIRDRTAITPGLPLA